MIALIIGILVSLLVTIAGTPMLIHLVHRLHYGQYIRQDGPKSHLVKRGTPTMGGVAIVLAIVLGWGASALYRYVRSGAVPSLSAMLVLFAMLSMGLLGFIDDFAKVRKKQNLGLSVHAKFIGQFIFATIYAVLALIIPTKSGFPSAQAGMSFIEKPFFDFRFAGGVVAAIIFVIWVNFLMTAWTNAVNLTDGLDGLAAGVCGIGCASMLAVSLFLPQATEISVLVAALGGACLGVLPFNINPAKIFMGDSGSLLLGYVLSTASVLGLFKMYTLVAFAVPVLTLALPLTDTVFAVVRRVSRGESPFHADRGHIHHRLLALGLTQKQAVAVLYAASGILGAAAVLLAANAAKRFWLLLGAVALALGIWLYVFAGHHFPSDPSVKAPKKDKKEDGSTKP